MAVFKDQKMRMDENKARCGTCGNVLELVRPGKMQCDFCESRDWAEWKARWLYEKKGREKLIDCIDRFSRSIRPLLNCYRRIQGAHLEHLRQAVVTLVLDSIGIPEEYRKAGKGKANAENQRG